MKDFAYNLLYYVGFFILYFIYQNSPISIDNLYGKLNLIELENLYLKYFIYLALFIALILIVKSEIKQFKNKSIQIIIRYFRRFRFLHCFNIIIGLALLTYLFSYLFFYSFLFINRTYTTSVDNYNYQIHQNKIDDEFIKNYLYNEGFITQDIFNKNIIQTKHNGLFKIPFQTDVKILE